MGIARSGDRHIHANLASQAEAHREKAAKARTASQERIQAIMLQHEKQMAEDIRCRQVERDLLASQAQHRLEHQKRMKELQQAARLAHQKKMEELENADKEIQAAINKTRVSEGDVSKFLHLVDGSLKNATVNHQKISDKLKRFSDLIARESNAKLTIETYFSSNKMERFVSILAAESFVNMDDIVCESADEYDEFKEIVDAGLEKKEGSKKMNCREQRLLKKWCMRETATTWKSVQKEKSEIVRESLLEAASQLSGFFDAMHNSIEEVSQILSHNAMAPEIVNNTAIECKKDNNPVSTNSIIQLCEKKGIMVIPRISTQGALEFFDFMNNAIERDAFEKFRVITDMYKEQEQRDDQIIGVATFVTEWNKQSTKTNINLNDITECLEKNNINQLYLKTHTRKQFTDLLTKECCLKKSAGNALWKYLNSSTKSLDFSAASSWADDADEMQKILNNVARRQTIIGETEWHKIKIFNKNNQNGRKVKLCMDQSEFMASFNESMDHNVIKVVPLVVFDEYERKRCINYVWIMHLKLFGDIGISFKYNKDNNTAVVNGIHLDKEYLYECHTLLPSHGSCNCLGHFSSKIDSLTIHCDDYDQGQLIDYQCKYEQYKTLIQKLINNPESRELQFEIKQILSGSGRCIQSSG